MISKFVVMKIISFTEMFKRNNNIKQHGHHNLVACAVIRSLRHHRILESHTINILRQIIKKIIVFADCLDIVYISSTNYLKTLHQSRSGFIGNISMGSIKTRAWAVLMFSLVKVLYMKSVCIPMWNRRIHHGHLKKTWL